MVAPPVPMLPTMRDAERERLERRLERDRQRREQGKPTYFESEATLDLWPIGQDPGDQPTAIIRPRRDRRELSELEAIGLDEEAQATQVFFRGTSLVFESMSTLWPSQRS